MLLTILSSIYFLIGGLLAGALLTDKNVNTNRLEAFFSFLAGVLWPLAVATAAGFALTENIREKIEVRRQVRADQVRRFCAKLLKLQLISRETLSKVK